MEAPVRRRPGRPGGREYHQADFDKIAKGISGGMKQLEACEGNENLRSAYKRYVARMKKYPNGKKKRVIPTKSPAKVRAEKRKLAVEPIPMDATLSSYENLERMKRNCVHEAGTIGYMQMYVKLEEHQARKMERQAIPTEEYSTSLMVHIKAAMEAAAAGKTMALYSKAPRK